LDIRSLAKRSTSSIFESVREAIDFVMQELTIADRANVWITTKHDNLTVEQIEKLQDSPCR
jgi:hypothetical protein